MDRIGRTILDILKLGRFHFLFGGLLLYILGAVMALEMGYHFGLIRAIFGYVVFAPAHLSVSYSNDLYDIEADAHNPGSPFSGGSGVLQKRPELRRVAFIISVLLIITSVSLSILFTVFYSITPFFVLVVILGSLLGWFYTAPPLKLSYRGWGEVCTAFAVGILVSLYGFIAVSGTLRSELLIFLFPMSLSGLVFIFNVQTPDIEADILGGKRTWASKLGRKASFVILSTMVFFQAIYYGLVMILPLELGGIRMQPFFIMSLIPVIASLPGAIGRPAERDSATFSVTLNMLALFMFLGGLDIIYLFVI
jgi:1,4-dihydroxy-2-naphthoate octaprenyltransferase